MCTMMRTVALAALIASACAPGGLAGDESFTDLSIDEWLDDEGDVSGAPDVPTLADVDYGCSPCDPGVGCDDGLLCSGTEQCLYDELYSDFCCIHQPVDCPGEDLCLVGACVEERGGCVLVPRDDDADGHPPLDCGYDDCNDSIYSVHPGARELCNDEDDDCDGAVDEDAWVPSGDPVDLSDPAAGPWSPSIAPGASSFGIAWLSDDGTGARIHAGVIAPGGPLVAEWPAAGESVDRIVVVPGGGGFVAAWAVSWGDGDQIRAVALDAAGAIVDPEVAVLGIPARILDLDAAVSGSGRIGFFFRSDVEWDYEIHFLGVDWPPVAVATAVNLRRITAAGGFSGSPSAAGLPTGFAVAWVDDRDADGEIYFATVSESGVAGAGRRITAAPGDGLVPSLAASPGGFGLAWMDSRTGVFDMLFTCLDGAGRRVCPELAVGRGVAGAWYPALAYDGFGDQYALVFAGLESDLFYARLTAAAPSSIPPPEEIDPGLAIGDPAAHVLAPGLADAAGYRGVVWIESDGAGRDTLRFQKLECI